MSSSGNALANTVLSCKSVDSSCSSINPSIQILNGLLSRYTALATDLTSHETGITPVLHTDELGYQSTRQVQIHCLLGS